MLPGARGLLTAVARAVLAAEAAGIASETTEQAAEYAKVRQQFGRPIATFQAVKTIAQHAGGGRTGHGRRMGCGDGRDRRR